MARSETTIGVSRETKLFVEAHKRGGETYDELLMKMAENYEPEVSEIEDGSSDSVIEETANE